MADTYDTTIKIKQGSTDSYVLKFYDDNDNLLPLDDISSASMVVKETIASASAFTTYVGSIDTVADEITFAVVAGSAATAGVYLWQLEYVDTGTTVKDDDYHSFIIQTSL